MANFLRSVRSEMNRENWLNIEIVVVLWHLINEYQLYELKLYK